MGTGMRRKWDRRSETWETSLESPDSISCCFAVLGLLFAFFLVEVAGPDEDVLRGSGPPSLGTTLRWGYIGIYHFRWQPWKPWKVSIGYE